MANNWTKEQQCAIDKQNSNILVSASAGSGKTAVLVERVINKVIKYNTDIDKVLVVTFTNASAVELKERLLLAIYKALDENPKNMFLKRQLKYINRASITTIHSFCLEILRSNFHVLDLDPNFKICDESQSTILKAKAMNKILEDKYLETVVNKDKNDDNFEVNSKSFSLYNMLELFSGKDENMIDTLLRIYSYIQSFDYPFEYLKNECEKYNVSEEKSKDLDLYNTDFGREIYLDAISEFEMLLKKTSDMRDILSGNEDFIKFAQVLDNDYSYLKICLTSNNSWDRLYKTLADFKMDRAPIYKGQNTELKDKISNFRKNIYKASINKIQKSIYTSSSNILLDNRAAYKYVKYIYGFLELFDIEYKRLKLEKNLIDFSDIEHLTLNLLVEKDENGVCSPTDIAKFVQSKFVEVYTDEYQDTSIIQEAILEAVSGSKNRFMVGDIKQSIYRFRQAMPDIFNKKYDEYGESNYDNIEKKRDLNDSYECLKIILAKNFRSRENILNSINYIFTQIMSKDMGDCNYSNLETLKFGANLYKENKDVDYTTEINIVDTSFKENRENEESEEGSQESSNETQINNYNDETSDTSKYINELKNFEIESICIAKKIQQLVNEFKVYDIKKEEFRDAKYKDIVILLRNIKDKGNILEKTLKKYNIKAFSDASSSLFESDEIKLVLSFLKIIDNPLQDIYMVSLMYSIVGDFRLSELAHIRKNNEKESIYENLKNKRKELEEKDNLSEKETLLLNKINTFNDIINKFINYSKIYKVSDLLVRMYKETNIYYQFALEKSSDIKKANLDLLIDFALKYEGQSNSGLSSYISYIDSLKNKQDNSTSTAKVLGENEDVVRIMTIHKSKGLEFPIVILCDTMRKYNTKDSSSEITMHHKLGIGINVVNEEYRVTYPSVIKQAIKNRIVKETKSEELRMLYVALTRAKEKLIIFATLKDYNKKKNEQFVMYKKDNIDPAVVNKNSTYFENILMSLQKYDEKENIFKINIISDLENIVNDLDENKEILNISDKINILKEKNKLEEKDMIDLKEKIKSHFEYEYKYLDDVNMAKRVSVSELKKSSNEDFDNLDKNEIYVEELNKSTKNNTNFKFNIPSCIDSNITEYTAVRKGTLIHFILEHLDFKNINSKKELEEYIENLVKNNILNKDDASYININSIYNFLTSKIGKDLKEAKYIFREEEFVLKNSSVTKSYIQGVIDLYYINSFGNIILVDFKTDKTKDKNEFVSRYKKQLDIYKEALEKLTNKKVDKKYIYSFSIDSEIEVE